MGSRRWPSERQAGEAGTTEAWRTQRECWKVHARGVGKRCRNVFRLGSLHVVHTGGASGTREWLFRRWSPGIDELETGLSEVLRITCGERRLTGTSDASDHCVSNIDGPPDFPQLGRNCRRMSSGVRIKIKHSTVQIMFNCTTKFGPQSITSTPGWKAMQTVFDLVNADAGGPERCQRLRIQPENKFCFRLSHQPGDDIRVENNHHSKLRGSDSCRGNSGRSCVGS